jgi:ABC-type oligopeptide transport system substrate-binding subunit
LGIKALDEKTLRINLEHPSSYFLYLLAHHMTLPVPGHIIASQGDAWTDLDNFVSNGPFCLESYERGRLIVLRRNPTYHGQFRGNLEVVQFHILIDKVGRLDDIMPSYENDEYDILPIYLLPAAERQQAIQRHAADYVTRPELMTFYVGFNVRRPPFDDPRVRQAFVMATDRQALIAVSEMGFWHTPATGGFIPLGMPGHAPDISLPFDLEKARRFLAEAGYYGGRGFPNISALTFEIGQRFFEALSNSWRSGLGVEISWEHLEWSAFIKRIREKTNRPHIHALGWSADYPDPDSMMRLGKESATNWDNEVYDALVEQARRVLDHNERMRLYRQAEEIVVREAPLFPISYNREHLLVKPWVKNYRPTGIGQETLKDIIIDPH